MFECLATKLAVPFMLSISCICGSLIAAQESRDAATSFAVSGQVVGFDDEPIAGSLVIPLNEHGVPLSKKTGKAVTMTDLDKADDFNAILFSRTDDKGQFELRLPAGKYRFFAQSWLAKADINNLLAKNGIEIRLDGVKDSVEIESEEAPEIKIKPIGNARISIDLRVGNSSTLLLVSTKPLAGDPVLGFAAWSGGFWAGLIGGNRMLKGDTVISGLPSGKIQLAAFANDNNPGFGGVLVELEGGEDKKVDIPLIASWSDGHKTPPDRLVWLVEHMKNNPADADRVQRYIMARVERMNEKRPDLISYSIRAAEHLSDEFELTGGKKTTVGDGLAAMAYVRLAK